MSAKWVSGAVLAGLVLIAAGCSGGGTGASGDGEILLGLPLDQTAGVGVSDHADFESGVQLAIDEINAEGGVNGRQLRTQTVDTNPIDAGSITSAFTTLADRNVQAILSPFTFIPQSAMDAAATYGAPYLHGDTQQGAIDVFESDPVKYANAFMLDGPEVFYGEAFAPYLDELESQGWKPKNNRVHIVSCEIGYCQTIQQAAEESINASNGKWELSNVTQITSPVQDWGAVISALRQEDAGVIMIDHWIASELASFAKAWAANPVQDALVYLQYGPSQPEFLELAGTDGDGFVWASMTALRPTETAEAFRVKYEEKFGDPGLLYSGMGYDAVYMLKEVWDANGSTDFDAAVASLQAISFDGVLGQYNFDPATQSAVTYPWETDDLAASLPMPWLQIRDGVSEIVAPQEVAEATFEPGAAAWMTK